MNSLDLIDFRWFDWFQIIWLISMNELLMNWLDLMNSLDLIDFRWFYWFQWMNYWWIHSIWLISDDFIAMHVPAGKKLHVGRGVGHSGHNLRAELGRERHAPAAAAGRRSQAQQRLHRFHARHSPSATRFLHLFNPFLVLTLI